MLCQKCGTQLEDGAKFCLECGASTQAKEQETAQDAGFTPIYNYKLQQHVTPAPQPKQKPPKQRRPPATKEIKPRASRRKFSKKGIAVFVSVLILIGVISPLVLLNGNRKKKGAGGLR